LRALSNVQKISFVIIILAGALIAYAIGVATGFFANEAFSMFFIISKEDAQSIAIYFSVLAGVLAIIALSIITLMKKRKITLPETDGKSTIRINQESNEISQEKPFVKASARQIVNPSVAQKLVQQKTIKTSAAKKQSPKEKMKFTCSNCNKQFSTPLSTRDYELKNAILHVKLSKYCPHCNQLIDSKYKMVQYNDKDKTLKL